MPCRRPFAAPFSVCVDPNFPVSDLCVTCVLMCFYRFIFTLTRWWVDFYRPVSCYLVFVACVLMAIPHAPFYDHVSVLCVYGAWLHCLCRVVLTCNTTWPQNKFSLYLFLPLCLSVYVPLYIFIFICLSLYPSFFSFLLFPLLFICLSLSLCFSFSSYFLSLVFFFPSLFLSFFLSFVCCLYCLFFLPFLSFSCLSFCLFFIPFSPSRFLLCVYDDRMFYVRNESGERLVKWILMFVIAAGTCGAREWSAQVCLLAYLARNLVIGEVGEDRICGLWLTRCWNSHREARECRLWHLAKEILGSCSFL